MHERSTPTNTVGSHGHAANIGHESATNVQALVNGYKKCLRQAACRSHMASESMNSGLGTPGTDTQTCTSQPCMHLQTENYRYHRAREAAPMQGGSCSRSIAVTKHKTRDSKTWLQHACLGCARKQEQDVPTTGSRCGLHVTTPLTNIMHSMHVRHCAWPKACQHTSRDRKDTQGSIGSKGHWDVASLVEKTSPQAWTACQQGRNRQMPHVADNHGPNPFPQDRDCRAAGCC